MSDLSPADFHVALAVCAVQHAEVREAPPEVLERIARRESGLRLFAVNVNRDNTRPSESRTFHSRAEAETFVQAKLNEGRSVDVGVMQVNLRAWPGIFPNLTAAFDVQTNVCAGARIYAAGQRRALCIYNTGRPECTNGYPQAVMAPPMVRVGFGRTQDVRKPVHAPPRSVSVLRAADPRQADTTVDLGGGGG